MKAHDANPIIFASSNFKHCPICGKEFTDRGGYGHGSVSVCSYKCQLEQEKRYRASNEYRRITDELEGNDYRRSNCTPNAVRETPGMVPGPLDGEDLAKLMETFPRIHPDRFQRIAKMALAGNKHEQIRKATHSDSSVVSLVVNAAMSKVEREDGGTKLTEQNRNAIRELYSLGTPLTALAMHYHVSMNTIKKALGMRGVK